MMFGRRKSLYDNKILTRFVVTKTNGVMFSGLLEAFTATEFVFADVKLMRDGFVPAEGRVYVDRASVDYLQETMAVNAVV